ncbi:MAG: hypothetical protein HYR97_04770 [Candidatus Melainabacteria bacterium]|nr:hypothetical protein [Candidatus Melainabacteria bacterium]
MVDPIDPAKVTKVKPAAQAGAPAKAAAPKGEAVKDEFGKITDSRAAIIVDNPKTPFSIDKDFTLRMLPLEDALKKLQQPGIKLSPIEAQTLDKKATPLPGLYLAGLQFRANLPISNIPLKNRERVEPTGVHIPPGADIPADIRTGLESGKIRISDLTQEQKDAITVKLAKEDVMPLQRGKTEEYRDFIASFTPDGKAYPYTLLPRHAMSNLGVPIVLQTKDSAGTQENIDPKSLRYTLYKDPRDGKVHEGIYFELAETKGSETNTNGVIAPVDHVLQLINTHGRNKKGGEAFIYQPVH